MNREEIIVFVKQNIKSIFLALIASIILICGLIYYNKDSGEDYNNIEFQDNSAKVEDKEKDKEKTTNIVVDVKGAVKTPGVYETTTEKRVKDILNEAGGLLEEADTTTINLSQKLKDQMVIYIPKKGEKISQTQNSNPNAVNNNNNNNVVNINTASKEELMKISGVGKTKAEAIISYREQNGDFKTKKDITKVKGIGEATYEKIKESIEV